MSFDREKLRRAAEKNLSQGKFQAAIREYCKLVESDPRDYNTLNTLGDLYVRVEAKQEAINCFRRIAEYYDTQGFTNKAIAMYKKIGRLRPEAIDIAAKLAPLYQNLGLKAEARMNYQVVADAYQKSGEQLKALGIWQQIADLDPNDIQTRLNLAESYLREEQKDKAAEAFAEAASRLLAKKQYEQALQGFIQALNIRPQDLASLRGATASQIALGFPDEAIEKIERAQTLLPEEPEIYSLLLQCYLELENAVEAEKAVVKLLEKDPASYLRLLDVTKLYVKQSELKNAARLVEVCAETLLTSGQEADLEFWVNEILTRDPEQVNALRLLAKLRGWQRNELDLKDALERLAEAARLNRDEDEEKSALFELRTLFPKQTQYLERLSELGIVISSEENNYDYQERDETDVPSFESFAPFADGDENTSFESKFESTNGWQAELETFEPVEQQDAAISEIFNFEITNEDSLKSFSADIVEADPQQSPNSDRQILQELESVDFYINQGYADLALESLKVLESQFGEHPGIAERKNRLQPADVVDVLNADVLVEVENDLSSTGFQIVPQVTQAELAVELEAKNGKNGSNGHSVIQPNSLANFDDLFDDFGEDVQVGELPATQTADFETHYNLGLAYKDMGLWDDAVEEFQTAVKMVATEDGTPRYLQCCNLIGHCFNEKGMPKIAAGWFQRGLDAPGHTEDEYQALRYELGMALEKAGELDRAIAQFTEIYAVNVAYRSVGEKLRTLQAQR